VRRILTTVTIAIALGTGAAKPLLAQSDSDFQLRQRMDVRWSIASNWTANTWGEFRLLDSAHELSNWRLSQQLQYSPSSNLTLGVGYTYIRQDGFEPLSGLDLDYHAHRAEFEATASVPLQGGVRLRCRLRPEYIHQEPGGVDRYQLRIRPEVVFPLHHCGPLKEIRTSDEFYVNLEDGSYRQNRVIPLSLNFALNSMIELRLQYVFDSFDVARGWIHAHALQTQLVLTLR